MDFSKFIFLFIFTLFCSGCSILNPYNEEFMCPNVSKGMCTSVEDAYANSTQPLVAPATLPQKQIATDSQNTFELNRNIILSNIIKEPKQPVMSPPEIARVLILPYSTENGSMMYGERYAYIIIKQASFDVLATNQID